MDTITVTLTVEQAMALRSAAECRVMSDALGVDPGAANAAEQLEAVDNSPMRQAWEEIDLALQRADLG